MRVPAKNLVGEENRGWYVGAALLDFERSNIAGSIGLRHSVRDLVRFVKEEQIELSNEVQMELAERAVEAEIGRLISYRVITMQKRGEIPNHEASMNKLFRSEANQRIALTGTHILGMYTNLYRGENLAPLNGRFSHAYVQSVSGTIAAGTSEINRNVIATRGLGLPRG
ncbi:MAG: acyl-CoA dehydrogenase family protein [Dehalococcoidia bacterium]|nr:acyl-CoA dehydrogenase family protein [Dehalococcoidia bacterium]